MVKCLSPIEGISKVEQNAGIGYSDKTREKYLAVTRFSGRRDK
jgi:nicotinamide mononucleotide (NMN) deamidase PncC